MTHNKNTGLNQGLRVKIRRQPVLSDVTLLTDEDLYLFGEGSHFHLYEKLGAHPLTINGQ